MSVYIKKLKRLLKHDSFSNLLPIVEYWDEDKIFVLEGPAIGTTLLMQPTNGGNETIRNALTNLYKQSFPKDTTLQFSLVSTPDLDETLHGFDVIRGGRISADDQEQVTAMSDSIRAFYEKGSLTPINRSGFQFRNFEIWLTIKTPIRDALPTDREVKSFKDLIEQSIQLLSPFGPEEMDEVMLHRRLTVLLNMYDGEGWRGTPARHHRINNTEPLRESLIPTSTRVVPKATGVSFRNQYDNEVLFVKSLSLTGVPDELIYGDMLNLIGDWRYGSTGLYEHYMLTLNIHASDQGKERSNLQQKRNFVTNQARGPILQYLERLKFQKQDLDLINRELDQEGSRLLRYSVQMTVFSRNEKSADQFAKNAIGYYAQRNYTLKTNAYFSMPFLLASLPFGLSKEFIKSSSRFQLITSKALPFMSPHMASWKGNTTTPVILLTSRLGQVVSLDFFASDTNYNCFSFATSGAGKSFLAGYIINNYLGSGIKHQPIGHDIHFNDGTLCYIVDVGRSYEALANQYKGAQFIDFTNDTKYSLNPFMFVNEMHGPEGQATMVATILKLMASPTGNISDLQDSEIKRLLQELWLDRGRQSTVTDFSKLCLQNEIEEVRNIGRQLINFTEGHQYGEMFSNKNPPMDFKSRLVVVELENLKSDPHLQVVALMSVILSIQRQMFLSGNERRKIFLLDEAWQFLEDGGMMSFFARFVEDGYRTFRKYNASGITITQALLDAYQSKVGQAIINNSAFLMGLRQEEGAIDRLESEKMYSGSPLDFQLMKSLRTMKPRPGIKDPDVYSEVFLKTGQVSQVCRLYTGRKLQLILSTNPDEKSRRAELMERGLTLDEAIDEMLKQEGVEA